MKLWKIIICCIPISIAILVLIAVIGKITKRERRTIDDIIVFDEYSFNMPKNDITITIKYAE